MGSPRIIDAHHHLWDLEANDYPWLTSAVREMWIGDYAPIRKTYDISGYKRDTAGLDLRGSVHLQAGWDSRDPVGETRWLQGIAQQHGLPTAIVAFADPAAPDFADVLQGHLHASDRLRGIRMDVNWHEDPYFRFAERPDHMRDPRWRAGLALLEAHRLSFDLQVYLSEQATDAADLVRTFPRITFVLDHAGAPADKTTQGLARWRKGLAALAASPNVVVKVSGFDMFDHEWTLASVRPLVRAVRDAFGEDRILFASNFPVSSLYGPLTRLVDAYAEILSDGGAAALDKFFFRNAAQVYRLDPG